MTVFREGEGEGGVSMGSLSAIGSGVCVHVCVCLDRIN